MKQSTGLLNMIRSLFCTSFSRMASIRVKWSWNADWGHKRPATGQKETSDLISLHGGIINSCYRIYKLFIFFKGFFKCSEDEVCTSKIFILFISSMLQTWYYFSPISHTISLLLLGTFLGSFLALLATVCSLLFSQSLRIYVIPLQSFRNKKIYATPKFLFYVETDTLFIKIWPYFWHFCKQEETWRSFQVNLKQNMT